MSDEFALLRPATAEEAMALLRDRPDALPMAGGTDLLLDLEEGRQSARAVVSLARLPWRTLERTSGGLVVGGTLPLRALEFDPAIAVELPGLLDAVRAVGSVPLRHRATLGGNIVRASPASDMLPILVALGAVVELLGPAGVRELAIERFVRASRSVDLSRGELVRSVRLPLSAPSAYLWQRVRPSNDISQVGAAVALPAGSTGWRVALGGMVPSPTRIAEAEAELAGPTPSEGAIARAAERAASVARLTSDRRASEPYRRRLVEVLVRRALESALARRGAST